MLRFRIRNMTFGGCAKSVTKMLQSVDSEARIEIDSRNREVRVKSGALEAKFLAALERAGHPVALHSGLGGAG